jgi:hypothetical protein
MYFVWGELKLLFLMKLLLWNTIFIFDYLLFNVNCWFLWVAHKTENEVFIASSLYISDLACNIIIINFYRFWYIVNLTMLKLYLVLLFSFIKYNNFIIDGDGMIEKIRGTENNLHIAPRFVCL